MQSVLFVRNVWNGKVFELELKNAARPYGHPTVGGETITGILIYSTLFMIDNLDRNQG